MIVGMMRKQNEPPLTNSSINRMPRITPEIDKLLVEQAPAEDINRLLADVNVMPVVYVTKMVEQIDGSWQIEGTIRTLGSKSFVEGTLRDVI